MLRFRRWTPLAVYGAVWLLSVAAFWLLTGPTDGILYSLLVFYLILPLTALGCAFRLSDASVPGRGLALLLFAAGGMLAPYLTFSLANMLAHHKVNAPDAAGLLFGLAPGLLGLLAGSLVRRVQAGRKVR